MLVRPVLLFVCLVSVIGFTSNAVFAKSKASYRELAPHKLLNTLSLKQSKPTIDLVVAATGADQITLYWKGVKGAAGYLIYRSLISGTDYELITPKPVSPPDKGPGVENGFYFTDPKLTEGVEYFYILVAVDKQWIDIAYSEEISDVPTRRAIPWNTGDAQLIIDKVNFERSQDSPGWNPNGWTTAVGPNRVVYMNHIVDELPSAHAPTAIYDVEENLLTDMNGDASPATTDHSLPESGGLPTDVSRYERTSPPSGIFRKVVATPGHNKFSSHLIFPTETQGLSQVGPAGDTAYLYTGGEGAGHAFDIGFQKGSDSITGWQLFTLTKFKKGEIWEPYDCYKNIDPATLESDLVRKGTVRIVGAAYMEFRVPSPGGLPNQTGVFFIDAIRAGGSYHVTAVGGRVPTTINLQLFLKGFKQSQVNDFRLKRVNSIAQRLNVPGARVNANAPSILPEKQRGHYASGSFVRFAAWGSEFDDDRCVKVNNTLLELNVNTAKSGSYYQHPRIVNWRRYSGREFYFEDRIELYCRQP